MMAGPALFALLRRRKPQPRPVILPMRPESIRPTTRLVRHRRAEGPLRLGFHTSWHSDFYYRTLVWSWWAFLLMGSGFYLALNVVFAGLYLLVPGAIDHARPGSFTDAFFFSIQTMATIGYGVLSPSGTYANIVVTAETMVSLVFITFTTGITFARFSRPIGRVSFSRVATVAPHNGVPTLSVRLSNSRQNQILEADVGITLLRNELSAEGQTMRRFYDLPLARGHTPIFALTFTAMHAIDESSPLFGATPDSLAAEGAELLVTLTGLDETMSQTIHARTSFGPEDILFGLRFMDMFGYTETGRLVLNYDVFHAVTKVDEPIPAPLP
jgi:inward rectifier potassium channel